MSSSNEGTFCSCSVHSRQIQTELTKLLELKARLEDEAPSSGKFVLKCPKVRSSYIQSVVCTIYILYFMGTIQSVVIFHLFCKYGQKVVSQNFHVFFLSFFVIAVRVSFPEYKCTV